MASPCRYLFALVCILTVTLLVDGRRRRKFKRGYMMDRSNIIFVMADDLDVVLGSPEVMLKTKRLLRDEGVTFKNAFTSSPLCCPSRSSILTGRYTHNHHVHSNNRNCSGPGWIAKEEKETFGVFMQQAGYKTAYFGKYLNSYDGQRVPPGWDNWSGLIRNSKFYNYTLNVNGRLVRHYADYKNDYFTNVMTRESLKYFTSHTMKTNAKPLFMVVSYSATHGPEDAAPQHQHYFPNVKAPRLPNYNFTSYDKHWIIRNTPPLNDVTSKFVDVLHRKRLQTLLALDDAIEEIYIMLQKTGQIDNTYIVFTSDHGYHLGQFNQVKGKSQPYESDIRIPLYMRGPKIPKGKVREEIALNIDLAPTFLDIAGAKPNKLMDGTSLMDIAVGSIYNSINGRVLKPIWKDSVLVERGKLKPLSEMSTELKTDELDTLIFPSVRKVQKICSRFNYPKLPCTGDKKFVCYMKDDVWYVKKCQVQQEAKKCPCRKEDASNFSEDQGNVRSLLWQLERHFEKLKRRIKRQGITYFNNMLKSKQEMLQPAIKGQPLNLTKSSRRKLNIVNKTLITMSEKRKLELLLDKQIKRKLQELEYWQKQRHKLIVNRQIKKKLEKRLTKKIAKEESITNFNTSDPRSIFAAYSSSSVASSPLPVASTPSCECVKKKTKKKKKKKKGGLQMSCFTMTKDHWKTPPFWDGPDFTACVNTANSTYWCLRTINSTHNFLYCEYWTGFVEYFDMNKDPYQLHNIEHALKKDERTSLQEQLKHIRKCRGAKGCFLKAGQSFSIRKDMLKKWRRYARKKRFGNFELGGPVVSSVRGQKLKIRKRT